MNTSTNLVPIDDLPETIRASNIVPVDDLPESVTPLQGANQPTGELISQAHPYKQMAQEVIMDLTKFGGLTAGAAVGGASGTFGAGPAGTAIGGVTGGSLGYAGGGEFGRGILSLLSKVGIDLSAIPEEQRKNLTLPERLKRTGEELKEGAIFEMGGRLSGPIISKALKPLTPLLQKAPGLKKLVVPKAETEHLNYLYTKHNIQPFPSEVLKKESKTLSILEGVLGYSPGSGDVILNQSIKKIDRLNSLRRELITKGAKSIDVESVGNLIRNEAKDILGKYKGLKGESLNQMAEAFTRNFTSKTGTYASGKTVQGLLSENLKGMSKNVENLYKSVANRLGKNISKAHYLDDDIVNYAKKEFDIQMATPPGQRNVEILKSVRDYLPFKIPEKAWKKIIDEGAILPEGFKIIDNIPPSYSYQGLDNARGSLLSKVRNIKKAGLSTNESRVFSELSELIDNNMVKVASQYGDDIAALQNKARAASKTMHEMYDKDVFRIMKASPEDVLGRIINNKEVDLFYKIKNASGSEGLEPLRSAFYKNTLKKATEEGTLNVNKLQRLLDNIPNEIKDDILPKQQSQFLNQMIKQGKFINEKYMGRNKMQTLQFLETLSGMSNERVVSAIFKPDNVRNIKLARRLLSPQRMVEIEQTALRKIFKTKYGFKKDTNELTQSILHDSTMQEFKKHETALYELLPPGRSRDLNDFLKISANMKKVEQLALNSSQTAQVLMGWSAAKDVFKSVAKQPSELALKVLSYTGLPWTLAKIYTSKTALSYFKTAIKLPANSARAIELFSKAVMVAEQEKRKYGDSLLDNISNIQHLKGTSTITPKKSTTPKLLKDLLRGKKQ